MVWEPVVELSAEPFLPLSLVPSNFPRTTVECSLKPQGFTRSQKSYASRRNHFRFLVAQLLGSQASMIFAMTFPYSVNSMIFCC